MSMRKPSRSTVRRAKRLHKTRPKKAQEVDNAILSKTTTSFDVYKTDPSRWDIFGVDTPKRKRR